MESSGELIRVQAEREGAAAATTVAQAASLRKDLRFISQR
jgi:hypothetical protein